MKPKRVIPEFVLEQVARAICAEEGEDFMEFYQHFMKQAEVAIEAYVAATMLPEEASLMEALNLGVGGRGVAER